MREIFKIYNGPVYRGKGLERWRRSYKEIGESFREFSVDVGIRESEHAMTEQRLIWLRPFLETDLNEAKGGASQSLS